MLHSVETSLPFLYTIWGQFVLRVASSGVGMLTMARTGSAAVGSGREWRAAKKTGLMESFFWGRQPHTQRQLI